MCAKDTIKTPTATPSPQDAVFGIEHDDVIRAAVKGSKSPEDACDMGSLAAAIATLDETILKDTQQNQAVDQATVVDEASPNADDKNVKPDGSTSDMVIELIKA